MKGFRQQHQKIAHTLGARAISVVLLLALFFLVKGVWNVYQKEREAHENRIAAEKELAELEVRENELQNELASLKTSRGIEKELRQQFELAKEGENMIVIVDRFEEEEESAPEPKKWWKNLIPW